MAYKVACELLNYLCSAMFEPSTAGAAI